MIDKLRNTTESMSDIGHSITRTIVPIIVGFILAQATRHGFDIPAEDLTGVIEGVITGVYYVVVRLIEAKFPAFGILLGDTQKPVYFKREKAPRL